MFPAPVFPVSWFAVLYSFSSVPCRAAVWWSQRLQKDIAPNVFDLFSFAEEIWLSVRLGHRADAAGECAGPEVSLGNVHAMGEACRGQEGQAM